MLLLVQQESEDEQAPYFDEVNLSVRSLLMEWTQVWQKIFVVGQPIVTIGTSSRCHSSEDSRSCTSCELVDDSDRLNMCQPK